MEPVAVTPLSPETESRRPVMVEYWLASKLGQLWLTMHKGMRPRLGGLPGECALVARGQQLPAGRLYRAQAFAARVWWRASMITVLLLFPVIGAASALHVGRVGTDVAVGFMMLGGCAGTISIAQMGLLSFRSGLIRLYLLKADPQAADQPLPPGSLGWPSRWDWTAPMILEALIPGRIQSHASTAEVP
jgi:hypothetical protein